MTASAPPLVLASGSPRRRQVLEQLGVAFRVVPAPEGAETPWDGVEPPAAFAERMAGAKAAAVGARCPEAIVLAADTIVDLDGSVLEKPRDEAHAREMLARLAGRAHVVRTAAVAATQRRTVSGVESTTVRFRALDAAQIEAYVASGEPLDKAGAYGIQGYGAALVESIHGCYFNVMGFPVNRVLALLEQVGWRYAFPRRLAGLLLPLLLGLVPGILAAQSLVGRWEGDLVHAAAVLPVAVTFAADSSGCIDIPMGLASAQPRMGGSDDRLDRRARPAGAPLARGGASGPCRSTRFPGRAITSA